MSEPEWRVGRSLGRTIYRQVGDEPSKDDEFVGVMDTRELAAQVVDALNGLADYRAALRAEVESLVVEAGDGPGAIQQVLDLIDGIGE